MKADKKENALLKGKVSSQDLIFSVLSEKIKKGILSAGEELKQVELAKSFGVSRMPVREALNRLVAEGYAEKLSNRHIIVRGKKGSPDGLDLPMQEKIKEPLKNTAIQPINLLPAREQVASYLRKAIFRKEIETGTVLTLEETARRMGVSVTPVREALQLLSSQGLVRLRPNKGAVVLGMSTKNIRDHYAVRALLEGEAAYLAAQEETDISGIEAVYKDMKRSLAEKNYSAYKDYNESFHMAIWKACGNEKLEHLAANLWSGLSMGYLVTEEEYAKISSIEHDELMQALRAHDGKRARALMVAHMKRSMEDVLTNYRSFVTREEK